MSTKRKALKKGRRFDVFRRDAFTCLYCGRRPPAVTLQVDHIVPTSKGGSDDESNLATSCSDCNLGKSDKDLQQRPVGLVQSLEQRVELQQQLDELNKYLAAKQRRLKRSAERFAREWCSSIPGGDGMTFGKARINSVIRFMELLPIDILNRAAHAAISKVDPPNIAHDEQAFKYFCGICWGTIRDNGVTGK